MKRLRFNNINIPERYDKYFKDRIAKEKKFGLWRSRMRVMMKGIKNGMKVVELGCGQSLLLAEIKKNFPDCEVHGLDFSPFVIKEARKVFPNINYRVGDFFKTPYQDNSFDYVLGGEIIEHVEDPDDLIKEMVRICKPGGFLVLSTPSEDPSGGDPFHLWLFNAKSLKNLFLKYGTTRIIKCQGVPGYGMSLIAHCQIPSSFMHIIQTQITGKQGTRSLDKQKEWLETRIKIFKNYTIKSLLNQSEQNYLHWISFRPEEKDDPSVKDLEAFLKSFNYNFVFTFFGFQYPHPKFQTEEFKKTIPERLANSLLEVKQFYNKEKAVYLTVIDSDDLYHKDAFKEIQSHIFRTKGALYFQTGYVYDLNSKKLADWNPKTCPPFFTILYSAEVFFDAKQHLIYRPGYLPHMKIPVVFKAIKLSDRKYMYGVHGLNDTTTWGHEYRGKEYLDDKDKHKILKDFGIYLDA